MPTRGCKNWQSQRQVNQSLRDFSACNFSSLNARAVQMHKMRCHRYTITQETDDRHQKLHKSPSRETAFLVVLLDVSFLAPVLVYCRCTKYDVTETMLAPVFHTHGEMIRESMSQLRVVQHKVKCDVAKKGYFCDVTGCGILLGVFHPVFSILTFNITSTKIHKNQTKSSKKQAARQCIHQMHQWSMLP